MDLKTELHQSSGELFKRAMLGQNSTGLSLEFNHLSPPILSYCSGLWLRSKGLCRLWRMGGGRNRVNLPPPEGLSGEGGAFLENWNGQEQLAVVIASFSLLPLSRTCPLSHLPIIAVITDTLAESVGISW